MGIRTKLFDKGRLVEEQMVRFLIKLDKRVSTLEGSESGDIVDISALKTTVGDANSGLVKDVADLQTSKANANHTHTLNKITDLDTVEAVVTYIDESTETILLVKQTSE